ncbi:HsdM family class I SAM-dependent methyltransferase [Haemophilus influenzae]|uniref:HsdM family class I SAM-dependent methyltransferase n=1 Tax=Haemophilus influenzae TaxID=727 RepID=UPI000D01EA12|nr:N-6 DNA methylase [Haemophilus influenzae]PRJ91450.1 Restriction enzyme BgcI subunit alpha [Haemophilus influenzae]PRK62664.1 Restriction enzyme BgcI subunit alpha [Haemophilus influenzae]
MTKSSTQSYKLESDINDFVKAKLTSLGLEKLKDFNEESAMSDYLKEALRGSAKTKNKTNFGKPDFHFEGYRIPIIIENKLGLKKLKAETKSGLKFDEKSIANYAVNGALYYAQNMISSEKYHEVVAIGVAGDDSENISIDVYYVFGASEKAYKKIDTCNTFDFLENQATFEAFYKSAILSEEEKHKILISSQEELRVYAKKLNRLMHNHNITAAQRVLYVSGMLLSMQDIRDKDGNILGEGLIPDDLIGSKLEKSRDGKLITDQIEEFLKSRGISEQKYQLMLSSFSQISKDEQRDEPMENDKEVAKLLSKPSSTNKQVFTFIYENIFKSIDGFGGHIDMMGELYSEFLKYALGDGKELGIVLTPPYVTKLMAQILGINSSNRVMDLATGSAGFLISAMELMIDDAQKQFGKGTTKANELITQIKQNQLLGVELNAEMYTLAATNMILRGDGSSKIEKGSAFNRPDSLFTDFKADRILLNPPFSYDENGMPFIAYGLDKMEKGGLGAIIIQDSAGSGKAVLTNQKILKKHSLLASIKMPTDLFQPMAGVQTSIYIFEAHKSHDIDNIVKFIDFSNDGYKRTERSLSEIDHPVERYADMLKIYKAGKNAKVTPDLWNLADIYVEDFITLEGNDWNFTQHKKIDTKPTLVDFKKTVADYLAWEVSQLLKKESEQGK